MPQLPPYPRVLPDRFLKWLEELVRSYRGVPGFLEGTGSPEGVVDAVRGTRFFRTDGAAGTTLYYKSTVSGNTGWVAYG